jgi:hypothetical protein
VLVAESKSAQYALATAGKQNAAPAGDSAAKTVAVSNK